MNEEVEGDHKDGVVQPELEVAGADAKGPEVDKAPGEGKEAGRQRRGEDTPEVDGGDSGACALVAAFTFIY